MVQDEPYPGLLLEKRGVSLPHVAILDAQGRIHAIHEGETSVAGFNETLARAARVKTKLAALRERAEEGDSAARLELLEAQLMLQQMSLEEALLRLAKAGEMPVPQAKRIQGMITRLQVSDLGSRLGLSELTTAEAIAEFESYEKAGVEIEAPVAGIFWTLTLLKAQQERDIRSCETAIERMQQVMQAMGIDDEAGLKKLRADLEKMRGS
ncbi:MAG: hypothetical protein ACYTG5_22640 [Planctomycetota bacterium]|jgi:hypothetical protein